MISPLVRKAAMSLAALAHGPFEALDNSALYSNGAVCFRVDPLSRIIPEPLVTVTVPRSWAAIEESYRREMATHLTDEGWIVRNITVQSLEDVIEIKYLLEWMR